MFTLKDGRDFLYQWDVNRQIVVSDPTIKEVHFCNRTDDCSLVVEVYTENGERLANVPNVLLQTDWKINVYGYTGDYTKYDKCFRVIARTKPTDYAYTETEVLNYKVLETRINEACNNADGKALYAELMGEAAYNAKLYADEAANNANSAAERCDEAIAEILGSLEVIENGSY